MAGYGKQREPIDLIIAKGRKHLTKEEIATRRKTEVNTDDYKNVKAPDYLNKRQKKEFCEISEKLVNIGIMSELDEDCLARYLISKDIYLKFTKELDKLFKKKAMLQNEDNTEMQNLLSSEIESNLVNQDRAFKQCRQSAQDLGLTITSRCKIIVPELPEKPKENKFAKFVG